MCRLQGWVSNKILLNLKERKISFPVTVKVYLGTNKDTAETGIDGAAMEYIGKVSSVIKNDAHGGVNQKL